MKQVVAAVSLTLLPTMGSAAAVDLTGWTENGFQGNNGAGNWTVQVPDNDSVFQSLNGDPTVFFKPGSNAQGTSLAGEITVETAGDDDFIGFVLGYQDGELNSTNADFWLIDWKQATQPFGGSTADVGLSLSHVSGDIANGGNALPMFWEHTAPVTEVQDATTLGDTGWEDFTNYAFDLVFTQDLIEVSVNGQTELRYTSADNGSTFTDGAFGFYNYSQSSVRYAGITEDTVPTPSPIPLPASLPLLLLGLGGLVAMRRRSA